MYTLLIPFLLPVTRAIAASGEGVGAGTSGCGGGSVMAICNPLKASNITELILQIIDVLLVFAVPIIILYIMYAGYLFVTAQGDSGKISDARNALLYSVVGGVIVLGAKIIMAVIEGTVKNF